MRRMRSLTQGKKEWLEPSKAGAFNGSGGEGRTATLLIGGESPTMEHELVCPPITEFFHELRDEADRGLGGMDGRIRIVRLE